MQNSPRIQLVAGGDRAPYLDCLCSPEAGGRDGGRLVVPGECARGEVRAVCVCRLTSLKMHVDKLADLSSQRFFEQPCAVVFTPAAVPPAQE